MAKNEKRTTLVRRVVGIGILIAVVGLIAFAMRPQPVPGDFATVSRGPLQVTLDEEGETRVRDRFVVSAPVSGRLLRIELEPGDTVHVGETRLAVFEPSSPVQLDARETEAAKARVDAAKANLGRVKAEEKTTAAELQFAETNLERQRRLANDKVVAAETLDQARLDVERWQENLNASSFAVSAADYELKAARAQMRQTADLASAQAGDPLVLISPVNGVVLRRMRESESVVPVGEPLLDLGDPDNLEIISDYLSIDAFKIEAGQPVMIEQWGGDRPLAGRVRRVEPSGFTKISALGVEEQRVNVLIDVEEPREIWAALGDGFRVEVKVVIWQQDNVLQVPTSALFRDGDGGWAAFVVEDGVAHRRPVEVGHRNGLAAEILSGLEAGQQVIVHPSDAVTDGGKVERRTS